MLQERLCTMGRVSMFSNSLRNWASGYPTERAWQTFCRYIKGLFV